MLRELRSRSMDSNAHPGRYRVSLHRAKGTWFAHVLDLPGCIGRGSTEVEAVESARAVIRGYRQVARLLELDPARIILEINA
jgi:predicted RNase H-like HicB family nuclease